jgi:hypothetical protein
MSKYFPDDRHGIVMINKTSKGWSEFNLKEMQVKASFSTRKIGLKFIFNPKATKSWGYQPYDDGDGYSSPAPLAEHVKRMCHHMVRLV